MSGTNTTAPTPSGVPISSLPAAEAVTVTDGVFGVFAGKAQLADPKTLVASGLPSDVVKTGDLDAALSDSALGQYADQAEQHAADAGTSAAQAKTGAAAAAASAGQAAQTGVQVATIADGVKSDKQSIEDTAAATNNLVNSASATLDSISVYLTAAQNGEVPLTRRGGWNAETNTPALSSGVGTNGDFYTVTTAGSTALDGNATWAFGDALLFTGGKWNYWPKAAFPAVAQNLTALGLVRAGSAQIEGSSPDETLLTLQDGAGVGVGGIGTDGAFFGGGPRSQPAYGLTERGIVTPPVSVLGNEGDLLVQDEAGVTVHALELDGTARFGSMSLKSTGVSDITFGDRCGVVANLPAAPIEPQSLLAQPLASPHNRIPTANDDSTAGYAVGDLWGYNGETWQATSVVPGGAVWFRSPAAAALPGDLWGAALSGAWGACRVVSGYTGPLIDVAIVTDEAAPTITLTTINALSDGSLDEAALGRLLLLGVGNFQDAYAVRVYDQSGSGNHCLAPGWDGTGASTLTLAILRNSLTIGFKRIAGKLALCSSDAGMDFSGASLSRSATIPNSLSYNAAAFCLSLYGFSACSNGDNYGNTSLGSLGTGAQATCIGLGGHAQNGRVAFSTGPVSTFYPSETTLDTSAQSFLFSGIGSDKIQIDTMRTSGDQVALSSGWSTQTLAGGSVGFSVAPGIGGVSPLVTLGWTLADRAATATDVKNSRLAAIRLMNATPQVRRTVVWLGDSRSFGLRASYNDTIMGFFAEIFPGTRHINLAVPGSATSDLLANTISTAASVITSAAALGPVDVVLWYGVNDLEAGLSDATIVANLTSAISQCKSAGAQNAIVLGDYDAGLQSAYGAAFMAGTMGADAFVNPFPAAPFNDRYNWAWFFADHVHPLGQTLHALAGRIAPAYRNLTGV